MIKVRCPECEKLLTFEDDEAGEVVSCPKCDKRFRVPAAKARPRSAPEQASAGTAKPVKPKAPATPAKAAKPKPEQPRKPWQGDEDFSPYVFQEETAASAPLEQESRVDSLAKEVTRKKKRERAWNMVGPPAKAIKILAMISLILQILFFLYIMVALTLYGFNQTREEEEPIPNQPAATQEYKPLPPLDELADSMSAWGMFFLFVGAFIINMVIVGFTLAGAESMKRLENYNLAMASCVLMMIFWFPIGTMIGVWAMMTIRKPQVQAEFDLKPGEVREESE